MLFDEVAQIFQKIEETTLRNEMTSMLVDAYKKLDSRESQIFSYLIEGRVAPRFVDSEFHYSEKSLVNAFDKYFSALGRGEIVSRQRKSTGDIGLALFAVCSTEKYVSSSVTLTQIYEFLWEIVGCIGKSSVSRKNELLLDMCKKLSPLEVKYLVRILSGKLRLGVNVKSVLDCFSILMSGDKSMRDKLDLVYGFCADLGYIAKSVSLVVQNHGNTKVFDNPEPVPGIPFFPRLVERVPTIEEAVERMKNGCVLQPKYDGMRCQIHIISSSEREKELVVWHEYISKLLDNTADVAKNSTSLFNLPETHVNPIVTKRVKLYSRNLEDLTNMFPEIVKAAEGIDCVSGIFDCELVGVLNSKFITFQDTMTRRRKYDVVDVKQQIPVKAYVFDILHLDGEDIAQIDLKERIKLIGKYIKGDGALQIAPTHDVKTIEGINKYFEQYIKQNYEGVILKLTDGRYIPGVRNYDWIKLKKTIEEKVVDTIDLVVLGYYAGSGKQVKFKMGAILGGVYNSETGMYEPTTKIGTGITQDQWGVISKRLEDLVVDSKPKNVASGKYEMPDRWVDPVVVITVEADEITRSKIYPAGQELLGFGLALRFPRLTVFDRDKMPTDATGVEEYVKMYEMKKG